MHLTRTQKILIGIVATGAVAIAGIGFAGSYHAVTALAVQKGFGSFAQFFTLGIDIGIGIFLALDLLLTWLRMPYPLLRHGAWLLTAATISFNAAAAWPDPLGVGMHAVIPVLFVIAVEAARHATGRIADITADKHIESPPLTRWLLNPPGTFVLWRRQRMWGIRSWDEVVSLEQERRIYRAQLRKEFGWNWRGKASADQLLVLRLSADGMSIQEAIDRPHREAQKHAAAEAKRQAELRAQAEAEAEAKHEAELRQAEVEAKRRAEVAEAEAAEAEAKRRTEVAAEAARLEVEAKRRAESEAARILVAETEAKLATIARSEEIARTEADLKRRQQQAEATRIQQEQQRQADEARAAEVRKAREEKARTEARRLAAEATTRSTSTSGSTSGSDSDTGTSTSGSAPRSIAPQRGKRQAEVEAVLARIVEAGDPKSVSLEDVMTDFDLKQTTAYDRLKTAQDLYAEAQNPKSKTA
jgi:DNA segregation ATPase FtsK/SpoIIIE-like protein